MAKSWQEVVKDDPEMLACISTPDQMIRRAEYRKMAEKEANIRNTEDEDAFRSLCDYFRDSGLDRAATKHLHAGFNRMLRRNGVSLPTTPGACAQLREIAELAGRRGGATLAWAAYDKIAAAATAGKYKPAEHDIVPDVAFYFACIVQLFETAQTKNPTFVYALYYLDAHGFARFRGKNGLESWKLIAPDFAILAAHHVKTGDSYFLPFAAARACGWDGRIVRGVPDDSGTGSDGGQGGNQGSGSDGGPEPKPAPPRAVQKFGSDDFDM